MTRQLRIGVVGLGAVARFYLAALADVGSLRLTAVCDVDRALLSRFGGQLSPFGGEVTCHTDHRQMLRRSDLDAAVVTTPNDSHFTVCRDALEAGVAVCVEKPLSTRLADGEALMEAARARGVTLFTAFHRRYNAAVVTLARRLSPQPPVRRIVVRYFERIEEHVGRDRWYLDPARCGGGCVADNGPNAYDLVRLFLGDLQVTDAVVYRDAQEVDRKAVVLLRAASGATARVELDWSYEGERKELEVQLVDGTTYRVDMLSGHVGFKASLWHEYVGVLQDFARALSPTAQREDGGLPALALVNETYRAERVHNVARSAPPNPSRP
ncbi:MAG: Gfo/Idh/MocA family oxidoreductase [Actinomycetota bacterium]|nr:Gfo/Idh/MocA family oxidoreductase [Actinomycetota bacterium]